MRPDLKERQAELQVLRFIREVKKLEGKHGVVIQGCGCCGSAWAITKEGTTNIERIQDLDLSQIDRMIEERERSEAP